MLKREHLFFLAAGGYVTAKLVRSLLKGWLGVSL